MTSDEDDGVKTVQLIAPKITGRLRLDRYLTSELPQYSRSRLQHLIRHGFVRLNGDMARASDPVRAGDRIEVKEPPPAKTHYQAEAIPLHILFEDEDLLVIDKPAGLVIHPGAGHRDHTLVNALLHHCPTLSGIRAKNVRGLFTVSTRDKRMSGGGKKRYDSPRTCRPVRRSRRGKGLPGPGCRKIAERFRIDRSRYRAASHPSTTHDRGASTRPHRKNRIPSVAPWRCCHLVECRLHTGRTHQIRVHLHHLGHPVLGDKIYGAKSANNFPRQMLHAWKLAFRHPQTGQRKMFEAPLPEDFSEALQSVGIATS